MSPAYTQETTGRFAARPTLAWLLLSAVGGALSALVVAGVLAGRLGLPITGRLLLCAAALGALPQALAIVRRHGSDGTQRWIVHWPELVAALTALGAVGGAGLALAWPTLLPLGQSVDAIHHTLLIDWIAERGTLPQTDSDTLGRLGEMSAYPVGMALVVVAASELVGRPPLDVMYSVAALGGALIAVLVVLLANAAAQDRSYQAGDPRPRHAEQRLSAVAHLFGLLVGPLLLLAHRTYLMEAYVDHSYYTMVLGVLLLLLSAAWLLVEPRRSGATAAQLGLALAALACTYPLWVPLPIALALLVYRPSSALQLVLALGPAPALGLLDVLPRMRVGQAVLAHQGLVTLPTAQRLMPLLLALPCAALLARARCRAKPRRWLLALAALAALAALGLALAARVGLAAIYHSYKLLFVLTPLAAAIVGATATRLMGIRAAAGAIEAGDAAHEQRPGRAQMFAFCARSTLRPPRWLGPALLALALALTGSFQVVPPPPVQLLTPDLLAAARWLRANSPKDARRAIVVGAPIGPLSYWLQVGLLGQRRDHASLAARAFTITPPAPESWLVDDQLESVAIVPRLAAPLPGMIVVERFGSVAIVRRAARLDAAALNPLTIRYRTFWENARLKTAIEIQHPVSGPLPLLELCLYHDGAPITAFALPPEPHRTRPQYLGADLLPNTLGGSGYINRSAFPTFAPPEVVATGALTLTLRLSMSGNTVDERLLATFDRTSDGALERLAPGSGELIYLRHDSDAAILPRGAPAALDFEGALQLDGWRVPDRATAGAPAVVDLRWRAPHVLDRSLFPEVLVLDARGHVLAISLEAPQGGFYPTWRWRAGETVDERRALQLPPNLTPGVYRVALRVHDFAARRTLRPAGGTATGEMAEIGEVVVAE